ncbi:T9SS type A sorting domain-containing protein [Riemerella anatipestifer]|nr:T9SS type A sorting domain-containing protein [Riemerella anatipestifer]MDY3533965.1 T9SS type A sorting domain-containing protein [Riemerella anatipestifer]MDY3536179.1 T9SS type A sorting domain-containing protein [Riemerella anatipestifer]
MRKFYSLMATVALVATVSAQNLVQNPSFENDFSDWKAGFNTSYTAPEVVTGGAQDGDKYVSYKPTATTGFYQTIPVTEGKTYIASFYYKAARSKDARIWSNFKDTNGTVIYLNSTNTNDPLRNNNGYLSAATEWAKYEVEFVAPATVVSMDFAVRAYSGADASFDNFSLVEKSTMSVSDVNAKKINLVKNTVVDTQLLFGADADIKIYNVNGQLVKSAKVNNGETLNLSSLPKGVYIVSGEVNGEKVSQKIIKK